MVQHQLLFYCYYANVHVCDGYYGYLIVEVLRVASVVNCRRCLIIPPFRLTLK